MAKRNETVVSATNLKKHYRYLELSSTDKKGLAYGKGKRGLNIKKKKGLTALVTRYKGELFFAYI